MQSPWHPSRLRAWAVLVYSAAVAGCGSDDNQEAPVGTTGTGGQTILGSGGASGVGGVIGVGGATAPASWGGTSQTSSTQGTGGTNKGQVLVTSFHTDSFGPVMLPMFQANVADDACASQRQGSCTLRPTCTSTPAIHYVSAGTLTLSSSSLAANVVVEPGANGSSYMSAAFRASLSGGERLSVAASGAVVPAFSTEIFVPFDLLVESPIADATGTVFADASTDLTLRFSQGATGVDLVLQGSSAKGSVVCSVASETGILTVSAGILAALGSGTIVTVWTYASKTFSVGNWQLEVGFIKDAYTSDESHPVSIQIQ